MEWHLASMKWSSLLHKFVCVTMCEARGVFGEVAKFTHSPNHKNKQ